MKNRLRIILLFAIFACLNDFSTCLAQVNSWTNPAGGRWENVSSWSLGILPGTNQTILLTNEGSKTIEIKRRTVQRYPESLNVDTIGISSPPNSTNTLVLQHTEAATPLRANYLTIGSSAAAVVSSSTMKIAQQFEIDGRFVQDDSVVLCGFLNLGYEAPASYELNSGLLASGISYEALGAGRFPARFIQRGGTNHATAVLLRTNSNYELNDGLLEAAINIKAGATFTQRGGRVDDSGGGLLINGSFFQFGGDFIGPTNGITYIPFSWFDIGASAFAVQTGGTNQQSSLFIGNPGQPELSDPSGGCYGMSPYSGSYTLSNAVLITSATAVGANGTVDQTGGALLSHDLLVQGSLAYVSIHHTTNVGVSCVHPATYRLRSGASRVDGDVFIGVAGSIVQDGGTNVITGSLSFGNPTHISGTGYGYSGSYRLHGGTLIVSNLILSSPVFWSQSGGRLIAGDLQISGTTFQQTSGTVSQSGMLTLDHASVMLAGGQQQFGQLQPGPGTSALSLPNGACNIRFADSSGLVWPDGASVQIQNWSGSLHGGGQHRVIFGATAHALGAQQLASITFVNPTGVEPGNYPARMLSTGEIVPDTGAPVPAVVTLFSIHPTGAKRLQLDADPGQYAIEVSTDLLHWLTWTSEFNMDGTIVIEDADAVYWPQRFYRARLVQ